MKEQRKLLNGIENNLRGSSNNSCDNKNKSRKNRILYILFPVLAILLIFDIAIGIRYVKTEKIQKKASIEKHFDKNTFIRRSLDDPDQYPIGSCGELSGTTLIITIFTDDSADKWDFSKEEDQATAGRILKHLSQATDWIKKKAEYYGKDVDFIYDFNEYPDISYTDSLDMEFTDGYRHIEVQKTALLRGNWNTKGIELMDKYNADNIMFIYCFNKDRDTLMVPGASPYIRSELYTDYPLETILITPYSKGVEQGAAVYAHEILHLFGAPDLYTADTDGTNYGITEDFVAFCDRNHKNEIMVSMKNIYSVLDDPDAITNDLTDLTAYYIGWIDENTECSSYGVDTSEHTGR